MGLHPDCTGNRAGREVASCRVALQGHSALPARQTKNLPASERLRAKGVNHLVINQG